MISPTHDFVGGIIKQIVRIKLQHFGGREIVVEQPSAHIDGIAEVDAVVPVVGEADPFFKGKEAIRGIIFRGQSVVLQNSSSFQIGGVSLFCRGKAAKADMLAATGEGGAKISLSAFFESGEDSFRVSRILLRVGNFFCHWQHLFLFSIAFFRQFGQLPGYIFPFCVIY